MSQIYVFPIRLFLLFTLVCVQGVNAFTWQENEASSTQEQKSEQTNQADTKTVAATDTNPDSTANEETATATKPPTKINREIAAPINFLKQQQQDIKHYLEPSIVNPILVGPKEHISLLEVNKTTTAKGVMILLPDWQKNATNSKALNFLRQQLPYQGWTTITIQPPAKPSNYPSHTVGRDKRIENNKKALTSYQDDLALLLKKIHEKAEEYPGVIVVISEGSNGALLSNIYQQKIAKIPTALILLSSFLPTVQDNKTVALSVAELPFPILDLTLFRDNIYVEAAAQLRANAVKQEMKPYYRQKQLHNITPAAYPNSQLIKEINGWLASIGW